MRSARSRTLMLAGISMTLSPLSLISHLRWQTPLGRRGASERLAQRRDMALDSTPEGPTTTNRGKRALRLIRQPAQGALQLLDRLWAQFGFQGPRQVAAQPGLPTRTLVVQIGAAARSLPGRVDVHALGPPDDPDQRALREDLTTTDACPLGHVPDAPGFLRRHRSDSPAYEAPPSQGSSPRLCRRVTTI